MQTEGPAEVDPTRPMDLAPGRGPVDQAVTLPGPWPLLNIPSGPEQHRFQAVTTESGAKVPILVDEEVAAGNESILSSRAPAANVHDVLSSPLAARSKAIALPVQDPHPWLTEYESKSVAEAV